MANLYAKYDNHPNLNGRLFSSSRTIISISLRGVMINDVQIRDSMVDVLPSNGDR